MGGLLLSLIAMLAGCTPASDNGDLSVTRSDQVDGGRAPVVEKSDVAVSGPKSAVERTLSATKRTDGGQMAEDTIDQAPERDSPAEAVGRRTLSTAFVRVAPDGLLTVDLRDGRVLTLRNVTMRAADYCGTQVQGDTEGAKYCGGYAEIAAARPGGQSTPQPRVEAAPNPLKFPPGDTVPR